MNESVRKTIEYRLQLVNESEESFQKNKVELENALLRNKTKLDLITKEKKELETFLIEYPL
ncbi:hypothetical protein LHA31_10265 [Carnobacterium viridans]|uniref:Uncharacterized protein n=1 Tax=Carnobacterium viridans TaxID=174587 RepID=A0A1H0YVV5_9LACT|nr:hypothetical protein [Carnobacterium viridans]UDE94928.1 hypothetical protein LHA31_10265 [Carnobacterium viridans]SDQ19051.1 hypothetical protein SAMN04487752_1173 [Carnobacterium viridans]